MAATLHQRRIRHAHVSFLRLMTSCERLVASDLAAPRAADPGQLREPTSDFDDSELDDGGADKLRLLKSYVPALSSLLDDLRSEMAAATEAQASSGKGGKGGPVMESAVSAAQLSEYGRKVVELRAVLASAQQLARHTSNPESASRPRVGVSRSLDAEVARRDRAQLLSSGAAGAKPAAGRETGRRTPPSPASSCSPKSRDGGRIVEGSVPAVRDKGDVGAQEPVPSPRGDAGDDGGRRDAPAQPSPRSPADSLFDRPGGMRRRRGRGGDDESGGMELLMQERENQAKIEEDMLPMTRSFLESAKAINRRITDDNKKLEASAADMEDNVAEISKAKSTLEAQNRSTWSSMCQTLVMLLFVTAVFLVVYFIIRVTPKP